MSRSAHWRRIQSGTATAWQSFLAATDDCRQSQDRFLSDLLISSRDTVFGRQHGFSTIRNSDDFRERVPLRDFSAHAEWLARIESGERDILFPGRPLAFEKTSGSTEGGKVIPITSRSIEQFQRALFPWLHDLLLNHPGVSIGASYWALSPVTADSELLGDVPVGLDDAAYFGVLARELAGVLAVPPCLTRLRNVDEWKGRTLAHLVGCRDLSFLSVWSPTFLTELLAWGRKNVSAVEPYASKASRAALDDLGQGKFAAIWPALSLISCWADGFSRPYAAVLAKHFPDCAMEPKGLLATEGAVTIPIAGSPAPVLALQSGFFEFLDENGRSRLANEVTCGVEYRVVLTNGSGLYRYPLGDVVRMEGWRGSTPLFRFVGRAKTSDLCGEKLHEAFVGKCLNEVMEPRNGFAMLVPRSEPTPHYLLVFDPAEVPANRREPLAERLEKALLGNPHYAYARKVGQLSPVVAHPMAFALENYSRMAQVETRLATLKVSPLCLREPAGWLATRRADSPPLG